MHAIVHRTAEAARTSVRMIVQCLRHATFVALLRAALPERATRWLHASVLVYTALLPFNAFGFRIPFTAYVVKYTEVAFLAIVLCCVIAYREKRLPMQRAYWLYAFLLLQAAIQFLSLIGTAHARDGLPVAISVASYSVLVFVLMHAIRTAALIRGMFVIMAATTIAIVSHSMAVFFLQDGIFNPRLASQPSMIGNEHPHYFALGLILHGVGLVYLAFTERHQRWRRCFWLFVALWLYVIVLSSSKTALLALVVFLCALAVVLYKEYKKTFVLVLLLIAAVMVQSHIVPIKNNSLALGYAVTERVRTAVYTVTVAMRRPQVIPQAPSPPPSPSETVAATTPSPRAPSVPERVTPTPPAAVIPPEAPAPRAEPAFIGVYSEENLFRDRWRGGFGIRNSEVRTRGFIAGWEMGLSRPLLGVGVGESRYSIDDFSERVRSRLADTRYFSFVPLRDRVFSQRAFPEGYVGNYNMFLMVWAETGLLGLLALVGILVTVLIRACAVWWRTRGTNHRRELQFVLPTVVALLFFNQINVTWVHPWLWTVLAIIYASAVVSEDGAERV